MEVTYTNTKWDVLVCQWVLQIKNRALLIPHLIALGIPFFPLLFVLISGIYTGSILQGYFLRDLLALLYGTLIFTAIWTPVYLLICSVLFWFLVPAKMKNGAICEHTIILNENNLIEITDVNTTFSAWSGIREIGEIYGYVYLLNKANQGHIIPNRWFDNNIQAKEFIETAKTYHEKGKMFFEPPEIALLQRKAEVERMLGNKYKSLAKDSLID